MANLKYTFLRSIFFAGALYFFVFYFFVFTFSPKDAPLKPNLQFLGSILSQHDVQAKYYARPYVNHSPLKKQILEIKEIDALKNSAETSFPEKPLLANQVRSKKEKGTPQARTTPLPRAADDLSEPTLKQDNAEVYIPLKLPDEDHY